MNMVDMPDQDEDGSNNRFGAVHEFGSRNDPAGKYLGKLNGEPDDETADDDHHAEAKENEPIGHFLFKIEFAKFWFFASI